MANINISVSEFSCTSPSIGDTFRSGGGDFKFNYSWLGDSYNQLGMNALVQIFYSGDGAQYIEYTGGSVPNIANDYTITIDNFDTVSFKLKFTVDNGTVCEYDFNIPYSSIIIL